jgi:hypothetical protein
LRAILNPKLIGHTLFWYLESELDSVEMSHRFRLLKKELLLSFNEEFRNELLKQVHYFSYTHIEMSFRFFFCYFLKFLSFKFHIHIHSVECCSSPISCYCQTSERH